MPMSNRIQRLKTFVVTPAAFVGAAAICVGAIALAAAMPASKPVATSALPIPPSLSRPFRVTNGVVSGSIYAQFGATRVYLTDFPVYLKNTKTNVASASAATDRFGHYVLRGQANGDYLLCWSPLGWTAACAQQTVHVQSNITFMPAQRAVPGTGPSAAAVGGGLLWGRVRLADGSSPWFYDAYFGVKQDVQVTVKNGTTVVATAFTNSAGEFVFPYVPFGFAPNQLTATAGGGSATATAAPGKAAPVVLTIADKRPSIVGIATKVDGIQQREVPANATVQVTADVQDPDGDTVKVTWRAAPLNGTLGASTGTSNTWTLPGRPGIMALYALADDGKGGVAMSSAGVSAGATVSYFAVTLIDRLTHKVVTDATVTVNGTKADIEGKGVFVAKAAIRERYVVNVSAPGYFFVSRVYDHGEVFHQVQLEHPALGTLTNATDDITLTDTRKIWREQGYAGSVPATIHIGAHKLVGPSTKLLSGKITTEIGAINVSSEQFPGDNGGVRGGKDVGLVSYGAMQVELRDAAGHRLQLAANQSAEVTIPVPSQMAQKPPSTLTLWYYDEGTGYWTPFEKKAVYDAKKQAYVGTVTHLSAFNIDYDATDLACFRVLLDNVQTGQLKAKVTYVSGPILFPDSPFFDIHDTLNVIKRLPPNQTVHIALQKDDGTAEPDLLLLDDQQVVHADGNFDTGNATNPHFPPLPYSNCKTISVRTGLTAPSGVSTVPFLQMYSGIGTQGQTQDYYAHLDPGMSLSVTGPPPNPDAPPADTFSGGDHSTLGAFWALAGFNLPSSNPGGPNTAADDAHEAYLNFNDLGFGRDMHIREDGSGNVFAYVTNYTRADHQPDQNQLDAVYAYNQDQTKVVATVAMEATNFGGMSKVVKFFVYAGDQGSSRLIESADLDGLGQKFVPQLCQVCHGGQPYPTSGTPTTLDYALRTAAANPGAVLREFDLASFVYATDPTGTPGNIGVLTPTDLQTFYNLNQHVLHSGTQPALADLLGPSGFNPDSATFVLGWYPTGTGWNDAGTKQDLYVTVVSKSCRTCHIAFDASATIGGNSPGTLNWQDYPTFAFQSGTIGSAVCGSYKYMPHALMTYRNFWLGSLGGPYEPSKLAAFTTPEWGPALGSCQ